MGADLRWKTGKRKQLRAQGWLSAICKPSGKFWKRVAARAVRYGPAEFIASGGAYKKTWGPMEWA